MNRQQEVEEQCKRAAGWVPGKGFPTVKNPRTGWLIEVPKPVKMRMHHGEIVETGWENVYRAVLGGFATLIDPA